MGGAKPRALFRAGLTRLLKRFLTRLLKRLRGQIGQRVDEARGGPKRRRTQIEWQAKARGDLSILNIELDQGFDMLRNKGDGGDDQPDAILRRGVDFLLGPIHLIGPTRDW